jgi:hypothetical protein
MAEMRGVLLNLASQKLFQIAEPALPLWRFPF